MSIKKLEQLRSMSRIPTILELKQVREEWSNSPCEVGKEWNSIDWPTFDRMLADLLRVATLRRDLGRYTESELELALRMRRD